MMIEQSLQKQNILDVMVGFDLMEKFLGSGQSWKDFCIFEYSPAIIRDRLTSAGS
jgi:hypothetical protein